MERGGAPRYGELGFTGLGGALFHLFFCSSEFPEGRLEVFFCGFFLFLDVSGGSSFVNFSEKCNVLPTSVDTSFLHIV